MIAKAINNYYINKKPVFVKDHFERLLKSAKIIDKTIKLTDISKFQENINQLIKLNEIENGNIRIDVICSLPQMILFYQIEANYPKPEDYKNGVSAVLQFDERKNPNAKTFHKDLREKASIIKKESNAYETILVNNKNQITEGSKSNLFFVKDNIIYSAPEEQILAGITRKHIINIMNKLTIEHKQKTISTIELSNFDAAFISGTSPIILPLNKIDNHTFDVDNVLVRKLMNEFSLGK